MTKRCASFPMPHRNRERECRARASQGILWHTTGIRRPRAPNSRGRARRVLQELEPEVVCSIGSRRYDLARRRPYPLRGSLGAGGPILSHRRHLSDGEFITLYGVRRLPRRPRRRVPWRALPRGACRARRRVLHPGRVEGPPPAALVVLSQLQVVTLTVHPHRDVSNASPRVQPRAESVKGAVVYEGREHPAKPTAARRSWPRWSSTLLDNCVRSK